MRIITLASVFCALAVSAGCADSPTSPTPTSGCGVNPCVATTTTCPSGQTGTPPNNCTLPPVTNAAAACDFLIQATRSTDYTRLAVDGSLSVDTDLNGRDHPSCGWRMESMDASFLYLTATQAVVNGRLPDPVASVSGSGGGKAFYRMYVNTTGARRCGRLRLTSTVNDKVYYATRCQAG